jgi:hypothetical protein
MRCLSPQRKRGLPCLRCTAIAEFLRPSGRSRSFCGSRHTPFAVIASPTAHGVCLLLRLRLGRSGALPVYLIAVASRRRVGHFRRLRPWHESRRRTERRHAGLGDNRRIHAVAGVWRRAARAVVLQNGSVSHLAARFAAPSIRSAGQTQAIKKRSVPAAGAGAGASRHESEARGDHGGGQTLTYHGQILCMEKAGQGRPPRTRRSGGNRPS